MAIRAFSFLLPLGWHKGVSYRFVLVTIVTRVSGIWYECGKPFERAIAIPQ